jgi:hypothetical protein
MSGWTCFSWARVWHAFWPEVSEEDKKSPDADETIAFYQDMIVCIHTDGTVGMRTMELTLQDLRYLHIQLAREYQTYELVKMNTKVETHER